MALPVRLPGDRAGGAQRCAAAVDAGPEPLKFGVQPGFWGFLVVIVLTSPIQAMAEEIFFRGYLLQALGSLVSTPWFGVIVSSVVFALLHGTQNLPLFVDRLRLRAAGGRPGLADRRARGRIAAHVVNNVFAYVIAGLTSSIAALKAIRRSAGWTRSSTSAASPCSRCWPSCSGPGSS